MKISDEISLSARNLLRRKGRTALTLVGVVIGTCMVVLMISLGIAQTKTNEEMLQSWGDLTQVQIYGYGTMVGSDGKPLYLDDAAIANIKQIPHVAAATPYAQAYNLEGTITAGRNDRYTMEIYNLIGIDPTALEPMGFALQSGSWLTNTPASEKAAKLQILVGGSTGYEFQDSRKSYNSPKRYRWQGQTDANGKELPPFVDIDKDKMTLTIRTGEELHRKDPQLAAGGRGRAGAGRRQGLLDPERRCAAHSGHEDAAKGLQRHDQNQDRGKELRTGLRQGR